MIRTLRLYSFYLHLISNLLPLVAFAMAGFLRFTLIGPPQAFDPTSYAVLLLIVTLLWSIAGEHYDVTNATKLLVERTGLKGITAAVSATYLVLCGVLFFYRTSSYSRLVVAGSALALLMLATTMRWVFRTLVKRGALLKPPRVLLIGADQFARRIAKRLQQSQTPSCLIVGCVQLPEQEVAIKGLPIYHLGSISNFAVSDEIDDVVIALHPTRWVEIPTIMRSLEHFSVPTRLVVEFGEGIVIQDKLFQFGRLNILDLATTPVDSISYLLMKRAFDIAFSLFAIAVTGLPMLLIAFAIKLTSRGPVLFNQERVGLNGKVFSMLKFRTMKVSSKSESDTKWTTENDPRRTRLGTFLRKTSLDELPQFFNVLKGDMSVVGPRPERPHFVEQFLHEVAKYNQRHRLKVGITGWAQVNGFRGDTSIPKRVQCDLYYLQNWSLRFDLRIIALTLWTGLFGKNAY